MRNIVNFAILYFKTTSRDSLCPFRSWVLHKGLVVCEKLWILFESYIQLVPSFYSQLTVVGKTRVVRLQGKWHFVPSIRLLLHTILQDPEKSLIFLGIGFRLVTCLSKVSFQVENAKPLVISDTSTLLHAPSSLSSLLLDLRTLPITPQLSAVLTAYGSSSPPATISFGRIAFGQLLPIKIEISATGWYGVNLSATLFRCSHSLANSGLRPLASSQHTLFGNPELLIRRSCWYLLLRSALALSSTGVRLMDLPDGTVRTKSGTHN